MKLYFAPLACSAASRIAIYEAGADIEFVQVDTRTKTTVGGDDYRTIHPLGLVPALVLDDGATLTENAAILQFIAERYPQAALAPRDPLGRARLQQWLSFIGTELHKSLFNPLLSASAPEGAKAYALSKAETRLAWASSMLEGGDYALGAFSVADAYLVAVLNWSSATHVDLTPWPVLRAYQARVRARPNVARAFAEEGALYAREQARRAAEEARPATP
jgi:glutathione S-transferase